MTTPDLTSNIIGNKIRGFRLKKGISQDRLSKLTDLSLNTIVKIEAGKNNNPTIQTLIRIAASLDVRLGDLIW
ncbi:MAG: helix-turn-helix domain-containing protein [Deltaproteobacteria bacterium]